MKRITPSPKRSFISLLLAVTVWLRPEAQAAFVANPSFESNYNDTWPMSVALTDGSEGPA